MNTLYTVDDLHQQATERTGLTDFGADDYLEGLDILLDSYRREAGLTPLGVAATREILIGALIARAKSEAALESFPAHRDIPIERPIFVTGLPRTGTTALHRLLSVDPAAQGLEMWLAERPQPRPADRESWPSNPDFQEINAMYAAQHIENPDMMGMHYMDAYTVEECWRVLQQSMRSIAHECLAYIPTYSEWLSKQDWTIPYLRHRQNLQLIGSNDIEKRWVLKNPSHMFALDEIMQVYPDALIIATHRDPQTVIASMSSVNQQATIGWSDTFTAEKVGATQLELWARGLEKFTSARGSYNPDQFLDVDYHELVADPRAVVANVYAHFGIPLEDEARAVMAAEIADSRSGDRKPVHSYNLAEIGLTDQQVTERFAGIGVG